MPTNRSSTTSRRPTPCAPARRLSSTIASRTETGRPSIAVGRPFSKLMMTSSGACQLMVGSSVYEYTSLVGAFQRSSRNPVSTARPHTFWSIENGDFFDTLMGMAFSSAKVMAFSRVQA